jgi:Protein of unknown function (DUF2656)
VDNVTQGRMLLSHNFDIADGSLPALSREEFTAIFSTGLKDDDRIQCRSIAHSHWIMEILFPSDRSPQTVGSECARILTQHRQQAGHQSDILILGGVKTTPPTSNDPDALQPGEWGVDVVETANGDRFLAKIEWDVTVAQKPVESIFKVQLPIDL